jgi:CBS-domain-containing membrane protein
MKKARDIMSKNVVTVKKELAVEELSKQFVEHNVNGFPVIDENGKLAGVVTQGNLIDQHKNLHIPTVITLFDAVLVLESEKKFEEDVKKLTGSKVEDIYHPDAVTVTPDTDVEEVATLMADKDIHTIPVVDDEGKIVGIIGKLDLIRGLT